MSTRIIVKNLPKNITEEEIKKHFSQKGIITDVKIMHKENGRSRNFCFIGYKTEQSAKDAIKYFNQTYLKTMKISVEIAKLQGDPSLKKGKFSKNKKEKNDNNNDNKDENKDKDKDKDNDEIETKESKIKKILDLSKKTKNADKFDEVLKNQNQNEYKKEKEKENEEND